MYRMADISKTRKKRDIFGNEKSKKKSAKTALTLVFSLSTQNLSVFKISFYFTSHDNKLSKIRIPANEVSFCLLVLVGI